MHSAIEIGLTAANDAASGPAGSNGRTAGSFELKFLLPDAVTDELLHRARTHLAADPHCEAALGDRYRINSLYFDTVDLAVHRRLKSYGRRKYRLRRYGTESTVFLERKSKSNRLVRKRRTLIPDAELARLHHAATEQPTWPGHWFHRRLIARRLLPTCQVAYERVARVGTTPEGPIRFTVDRHVCCRAAASVELPCLVDGTRLPLGLNIVEFKYRVALPALFKSWIHEMALTPTASSKYRLSVEAVGLGAAASEFGRAAVDPKGAEESQATRILRQA